MATQTDAQRAFLDEPRYAVVATINANGTPQQAVLWYDLHMNTARGRLKDRTLVRGGRISFSIEDAYRYLNIRGTATLDADQERAHRDIARIVRRDTPVDRREQQTTHIRTEERVTIRITIDHVHARGI